MEQLTLERIITLAPEVGAILQEAEGETRQRGRLDDRYTRYKGLLAQWVGWYSPIEELRDPAAYQTVIRTLRAALDY